MQRKINLELLSKLRLENHINRIFLNLLTDHSKIEVKITPITN